MRNLIRYKKRFFMTIFGIGGCTALLLVGFGLKDSVSYIGEGQFEEVFAYDGSIIFDADAEEVEQEELAETVAADERITDSARMLETAVDVEKDGVLKALISLCRSRKRSFGITYSFRIERPGRPGSWTGTASSSRRSWQTFWVSPREAR